MTSWILPAAEGLTRGNNPWVWRGEHGYVALVQDGIRRGVRCMRPLEGMWCFSAPLVGPEPELLAQEFVECCGENEASWDRLVLSGVPLPGTRTFEAVIRAFGGRYAVYDIGRCVRCRASLDGGTEGFLRRRSRRFRQSLRRSERLAERLGIRFEAAQGDPAVLFAQVMEVEGRSWKGRSGVGVDQGVMRRFYELMLPRLIEVGALRLLYAWHEGTLAGYVLGGVRHGLYRGLQFSFDTAYAAIGLGNLLQLEQIRRLEPESVRIYDLGGRSRYKARWAETTFETMQLLVEKEP